MNTHRADAAGARRGPDRAWALCAALCAALAAAAGCAGARAPEAAPALAAGRCPPKDLRTLDRPGGDALHRAVADADLAATRRALAAGSDPNGRDGYEDTALAAAVAAEVYAFRERSPRQLRELAAQDAARARAQLDIVRALLDAGADPDGRSRYGDTALIRVAGAALPIDEESFAAAAAAQRRALVALLLERGARIDQGNDRGATALMAAAGNDRLAAALVATLLGRGADPRRVDCVGRTALSIARERGRDDAAELLKGALAPATKEPAGSQPAGPPPPKINP
ncbi:ankyrin repeat-containing exported protein [Lysobacter enzymogenes]|uniref:Ankyrin repeat-containing exported protein n=1 Tax=Lysobacter enzymogenes TaxID=69 RepID=A0A0S2DJG9_LYSEN|nr:ankyrin repeat domain-containing protein [Lysobacter enzymogenes]ALN58676.1 ankyrin repeat-containing exported protein [Lysobacter enzymogenes]